MPAFINLVGEKFGRLLVLEQAENRRDRVQWLCECDCGEVCTVGRDELRSGNTKSCGCLRRDLLTTHGLSRTPEYRRWIAMKARCVDPDHDEYYNYGGRGITVCERWLHNFQAFYDDMGARPSSKHTLERQDNDAGYSPHNCKWATRKEQSRNTRRNNLLTYSGKTQCVMDWAEELELAHSVIYQRLISGWSVNRTLATPVGV